MKLIFTAIFFLACISYTRGVGAREAAQFGRVTLILLPCGAAKGEALLFLDEDISDC